jgi:hypothetical protein
MPHKEHLIFPFTAILLAGLISACGASCPSETLSYGHHPFPEEELLPGNPSGMLTIKREEIGFDEIISGPVCNDTWWGTVYLTCDIQIPAWEDEAFFFKDCDLNITDGTVVYVEAHRDKPYYQGCSCHE